MIKFFDFLINSNLFISLCSTSLYLFYSLKSNDNFFISTSFLIFGGTYSAYHLLRYIPLRRGFYIDEKLKIFYKENTIFCIVSNIVAMASVIVGIKNLEIKNLLLLSISFILVVLYEKILFIKFELRKIPYLKPFMISLVWTIVTTCLNQKIDLMQSLDCFVFILLLSIPFDIKDINSDQLHKLKTIPMILKTKTNLLLGIAFLIYSILLYSIQFEVFLPLALVTYLALLKYSKSSPRLYYLGFDGLILARFLIYLGQY